MMRHSPHVFEYFLRHFSARWQQKPLKAYVWLLAIFLFACFCSVGNNCLFANETASDTTSLNTASILRVEHEITEYSLNNVLDILEDKIGTLTFDEIRSPAYTRMFTRFTGTSDPNFGHTRSAFWVRIRLLLPPEDEHTAKAHEDWFLEIAYPQLDNIRFFTPDALASTQETTRYSVRQSGDMFPFAMRDLSYRMPTFRLPTIVAISPNAAPHLDSGKYFFAQGSLPDSVLTVYFRLESQGSMTFPMMLRTGAAMSRHIVNEQFILGMFYGILLIMIGYNLFVFFSLRDVSYLFYISYILTYGMFLFIWNGLAFQYLWSESPLWHNRSVIVFMGLSGLAVFTFSQHYLDTRRFTPRAHRLMNVMMLYFVVGIVLAFILPFITAIHIMYGGPLLTLPIVLTVSVICIRKGYRPARYFLVAWILLLTTISMAALRNLNLLPSGPLTIYGLQIGSALEIFLLSLGLADRINVIKAEKKTAEEDALRSTELLIETLRQSEQELEKKVRERTSELEEANFALQEKNVVIEQERERSELLLLNILPQTIAARLMAGEQSIADRFRSATVLFADIAGFTNFASTTQPEELVGLLDTVFSEFDAISEQFGLEKIKTIGDCYMAVSGVPIPYNDHVERAADAALAMMTALEGLNSVFNTTLTMRIGLHSGAVVAGVIGKKKFAYDLWGDTVNTASRMESQGEAGKIHVSETVYLTLHHNTEKYRFSARGSMEIKGKGAMTTWFLVDGRE